MKFSLFSVDSHSVARILGKPLFAGSLSDVIAVLLADYEGEFAKLCITPNVDQVNRLVYDPLWRDQFAMSDLLLADGKPVELIFRLCGARGIQRITGADLLPAIVSAKESEGKSIAILGGKDDVRERAVQNLKSLSSSQTGIVGIALPFGDSDGDGQAIAELTHLKPDVVFVCLGSPKQERWILEHRESLPPAWFIGAGAAVDFSAGSVRRAPQITQKLGLEWLHRFFQEPRRLFRRYFIVGPLFVVVSLSLIAGRLFS